MSIIKGGNVTLTDEFASNGYLKQMDMGQSLSNVLTDSISPTNFAFAEEMWLQYDAHSYDSFLNNTLKAVSEVQNPEMLLRAAAGIAQLCETAQPLSARYKNAVIVYACSLLSQIAKVGLDEARQSIIPLLSIYDSLLKLANTTSQEPMMNTSAALKGASLVLDGIVSDLSTYVCGESEHFTSGNADLSNIVSQESQLTVESVYNVAVDIDQTGGACIPVHVRVLPLGSEGSEGITAMITVVGIPMQLEVISPVIVVISVVSDTSVVTNTAKVTSTRFPLRNSTVLSHPLCVWKATADSATWTICGEPTIDKATNSYICSNCPGDGGYFLIVNQQFITTILSAISTGHKMCISSISLITSILLTIFFTFP